MPELLVSSGSREQDWSHDNMSGFRHDVAGGNGTLIVDALHSQGYVPGTTGWAIFRNGDVEFNSGTFRGIVVAGQMFLYNGAPGLGNPPVAWTTTANHDPFGNVLPIAGGGVGTQNASGAVVMLGNVLNLHNADGSGGFLAGNSIGELQASSGLTVAKPQPSGLFLDPGATLGNVLVQGSFTSAQGTAAQPTIVVTDVPQAVGMPANWTAIGEGIRYWRNPNKTVTFQISAQIAAGAVSGTIPITTLAGNYAPIKQFRGCAPGVFANGTPNAATFNSRFECTAAGVVHILGFPGGASPGGITEFDGQWDIPLF